jgi:uncharacterized protein YegP (UPF0339 family)
MFVFKVFSSKKAFRRKQWYFHLSENGVVLFASEGYYNRGDALHTIDVIKQNAATATVVVEV